MATNGGGSSLRASLVAIFPMFIATLSLVTSIYNGYLNNKFVQIIQANLGRAEYMRTCKEVIDSYFQVKFRTGLLAEQTLHNPQSAPTGISSPHQVEAANAVNRFAALATYLANLRDEPTRARYTALSRQLERIVQDASRTPAAQPDRRFEQADQLFSGLNEDCVKSATDAAL